MKSDWTDWVFFLEMLSVERTEPFISELKLPFKVEEFPSVLIFVRACLEYHLLPAIRQHNAPDSSSAFVDSWNRYRRVEGVLSDKRLDELARRYGHFWTSIDIICAELSDIAAPRMVQALKDWFAKDFRGSPDPAWQWPWALRTLLTTNDLPTLIQVNPAPINSEKRQCIEEFCIRYRTEKDALEARFYNIKQSAKLGSPSLWERVLQHFPPDERPRSDYPWLSSIESCLQYRLLRYEWGKLKSELGAKTMEDLTRWILQHSSDLPWNTVLPEEPEPLPFTP
jgi:hypothetical protein